MSSSFPKDITLFEMRFNSSLTILDLIQPITDKVCEQLEFDEDGQYWIWLATQEALNNAIKHGNKMDPNKMVDFGVHVVDGEFRITIQDEGPGFDLTQVPDPTQPENLLKTSGRGIFYMKSFMDRVEYNTENGTKVTLVKRRQRAEVDSK